MSVALDYAERHECRNGGFVAIHAAADKHKRREHIAVSLLLADKGCQIELLPEIHIKDITSRKLFFPELSDDSAVNPDARFNGVLGDYKIPDANPISDKSVLNGLASTAAKGLSLCVFSFLEKSYSRQQILSKMRGALKNEAHHETLKEIWIVWADRSVLKIPRRLFAHKSFYRLAGVL